MDENKLNNIQNNPSFTTPTQPNTSTNSDNDWQNNSSNNQLLNTQPINTASMQSGLNMSTATTLSSSVGEPSHFAKESNKTKRIIAIFTALIIVTIAAVAIVFLTGVFNEHRVEVGDYTVVIDEDKWTSSIGQDGNTLILMNKENLSGIGILPYVKEITYDRLDQYGSLKSIIETFNNVQFESQSKQTIDNTRCIVVNIKYKKVVYANDKALKAFCEGKDGTVFLLEVEGANQTELNSNLSTGVSIINTAKQK